MAGHKKLVFVGVVCALGILPGAASAKSFGAGSEQSVEFFADNALVIYEYTIYIGSNEPNNTIKGYEIYFHRPGSRFDDLPAGMYGSFVRGSEERYLAVVDDSQTGGLIRWEQPVFVGRTSADVDLSVAPADYSDNLGMTAVGLWPPPGGGGGAWSDIRSAVALRLNMRLRQPEIPRTRWTLQNTSAYDITDCHIALDPWTRYLVLPDIPAGQSIEVEGQMDPAWQWSFGGMLSAPQPEPVVAFGPGGDLPTGKGFAEVFTGNAEFPTCGLGAAILAEPGAGERFAGGLGVIGRGAPNVGFQTFFEPAQLLPRSFGLYSLSTGGLVASGQEAPIYHYRDWDPAGTPAAPSGGPGTWDAATAAWSDGSSDDAWDSDAGHDAVFAGAPGEVSLDGQLAARTVTFHTSGYRLVGPGTLALSALGVHVPAGVEATIGADIVGDGALKKTGDGSLVLGGTNPCLGGTRVLGGTLVIGGDAQLGSMDGPPGVTIENGATLELTSGFTTGRRITIGEGGGAIHVPSGTFTILAADGGAAPGLTGSGKLTKTGPGELNLASGAAAGDLEITEGSVVVSGEQSVGFGRVRLHEGCTYRAGSVNNIFGNLTLDGAQFLFDGDGPPGEPGTALLKCGLTMTGGILVVGTGDSGATFDCGGITTYASADTALITTESDYPENQRMSLGYACPGAPVKLDIADGPAEVDMDIQIALDVGTLRANGSGVLRLSGTAANRFADIQSMSSAQGGRLELAKPEGVLALSSVGVLGPLKLIHSHQIADEASMDLYCGPFYVNGCSETLGTLAVTGGGAKIDMARGLGSAVTFADSRDVTWPGYARLWICNWGGDPDGGGSDRIVFGSDAHGLAPEQLQKIIFLEPEGLLPGNYDARILPSGEVVPAPAPASYWQHAPDAVGDWRVADNWSQGVPSASSEARIENGGTVTCPSGGVALNVCVGLSGSGRLELPRSSRVGAGSLAVGAAGVLAASGPFVEIELERDFYNHSTRAGEFDLSQATVRLRGYRPPDSPQLLEVAGADLGPDLSAWASNFALGRLTVFYGAVRLIDEFDNQLDGDGNEALYVDTLELCGNGWIELNGLSLYYRNAGPAKRLLYADADLDGDVDFLDYIALKRAAGTVGGALWSDGDTDGDGDVDRADFLTLRGHFGQLTLPSADVPGEPVPEPTALALIGVGAAVLLRRRRPPR